ncbi:vacuolar protein sorting-associated protein 26C-like [Oscarella lobularis]|uniref:vacuolar protein sorting-associated protein 26C-like n=1 Tax=Oscarella lobularis TaxID=121494 RepID=UPI00331354BE
MATIEIKLKKANKVYREGELIRGVVAVTTKNELPHQGIALSLEGSVSLQLSAKSVGLFEAFYNSLKPIQLLEYSMDLAKAGKIPSGKTEIPFEFPLKAKQGKPLYETYHGVFVNIQYTIRCDMKRSLLSRDLNKQQEFLVEYKPDSSTSMKASDQKRVDFEITPQSLNQAKEKTGLPKFLITGHLDSASCLITEPLRGELIVEKSSVPIKSIELQLVRVETCGCAEGYARDPTEIQNIQIGDGDVCRGMPIPIYMIFPRLFTCPTLATSSFKVEFEVNIVVIFKDDHLITENFPIKLTRF